MSSRGKRRICSRPGYIRGRPVNRRYWSIQQSQIHCELRSMMSAVQYTPPENPNALALHIEEIGRLEPFPFAHFAQPPKTSGGEFHQPKSKSIDGLLDRQYVCRSRFRTAKELAEEPAFRQELMPHDFFYGAGTRMRPPDQIGGCEHLPDGSRLVCLACIGVHEMLKHRYRGSRHFLAGNIDLIVFHLLTRPAVSSLR
jgi:hypothetical protein